MVKAAKKRRESSRRKKAVVKKIKKTEERKWGNEALSIVFFALGFFLLLSFCSFKVHSPGIFEANADIGTRNIMGPVGHVIGTMLYGFMGWCALVPVLWLGYLACYFWTYDEGKRDFELNSKIFVLLGLLGVFFFSCSFASLFWGQSGGGAMGMLLAGPISKYFNTGGSSLIMAACLLMSLALAAQQSLGRILLNAFYIVRFVLCLCLLTIPVFTIKSLILLGQLIFKAMVSLYALLPFRAARDIEEEPEEQLPKPRRRKNRAPVDEKKLKKSKVVVERQVLKDKASIRKLNKIRKRVKETTKTQDEEGLFENYQPPSLDLLKAGTPADSGENDKELRRKSLIIEKKLRDFNIQGRVTFVHPGPVVTLFEFEPAPGIKVGKIAALQDDLAMSLKALSIRIIAPIPKRGTVGIEVPNKQREIVRLREVMESELFASADSLLTVPLGKDVYGNPVVSNISSMPHLLMAGATGSGKSVCINSVLISLLYSSSPAELGLILIDPKILELSVYEGVPHLRVPVVTEARKARAVLLWAANEMEKRYRLMQQFGVRSIDGYNRVVQGEDLASVKKDMEKDESNISLEEKNALNQDESKETKTRSEKEPIIAEKLKPLPKIVIVVDELADLMLTVGREIEDLITRLAQKARAAGIHLIIATQRPSVDVITGLIKANFPARMSFRVSSRIDSRTILDSMGADKLLGMGDMLFMSPGAVHLQRIHGAYVSDSEVKKVVAHVKESAKPKYDEEIIEMCEKALEEEGSASSKSKNADEEYDSFYDEAVQLVVDKRQASVSMLQRAFRIGYNRAARIIDVMEKEGIVGPMDGSKPRDILIGNMEE